MDVYAIIRQAILDKSIIVATYNGHRREMCPHTLGVSKKGKRACLFYQFAGSSERGLEADGSVKNWRCIPVDGLSEVEVQKGAWHTAENHSRRQSCVSRIDVEVTF